MPLKNATFRAEVELTDLTFGAQSTDILKGQADTVTLPMPERATEEWTGSGITTETIRTVIRPMTATYVLGGWAERLRLGIGNRQTTIQVREFKRLEDDGGNLGQGASRFEEVVHEMIGPLQDPDHGAISQAAINRITIMQDVEVYRIRNSAGGIVREIDVKLGTSKRASAATLGLASTTLEDIL